MYAKQRDDKLHANLSPKRWNIGVDRLYNAAYPRNIGQKNSSPLKIKRVKFVKILSSNSPSFFSARQIHARLSLSLFLTNHLRARTHYVRFFFRFNDFWGGGGGGGIFPSEREIRGFEEKLGWTGWKYGTLFEGRFSKVFEMGDRGKGAQPFICLAEACRVRGIRLPFRRISPQIFSWHAPHPIYTIFWKSFIRFPPFPLPSFAPLLA